MTEIVNVNAALETMKNYGKEVNAGANQERSGLKTVAQSVWDTTSTIATTTIDGAVKVVEGTADIGVGIFKEAAAVAKLPFTLTNSLFNNSNITNTDSNIKQTDGQPIKNLGSKPEPVIPQAPCDTFIEDPSKLLADPFLVPIIE